MEKTIASTDKAEKKKSHYRFIPTGVPCLVIVTLLFWYIGSIMGLPNMLNTIMHTAHDLLLNTVFYLMGICVVTGASRTSVCGIWRCQAIGESPASAHEATV